MVVDDNRDILSAVRLLAENYFEEVVTLSSPNLLLSGVRTHKIDVVLLDMNYHAGINNGNEGLFWLGELNRNFPDVKVVLFTAYADISLAVEAMKRGAFDFVVKPWDNDRLVETLRNALRLRRGKGKERVAKEERAMFWGGSEEMKRIRSVVERVAATDANVLITGENGTGKEMLAREIHRLSLRSAKSMVALDMGAIPEHLFESELFGHRKGAFTDATADREGKLQSASGSTLFLDEIGNLPPHMQSKMLSALQNRSVTPLGSNEAIPIDVRLISATNSDLYGAVEKGDFRQDLLFRINTIHLHLPPLRQRREDIIPLAEMFVELYGRRYGKEGLTISAEAAKSLKEHGWDGNIRELQNSIEKAVIMCEGREIGVVDIELRESSRPINEVQTLEEMERQIIANTIRSCGGNISLVAQKLGITRQTLYNKIKRYGL